MSYTRLQLQTGVYADLQQPATNNSKLTAVMVQEALLLGEQDFARRTRCLRRDASVSAVNAQAVYALPADFVGVEAITYSTDSLPLGKPTPQQVRLNFPDYRTQSAGTPLYWWSETRDSVRLYPAPAISGATTFSVDGYYVPLAVGGIAVTGGVLPMLADGDVSVISPLFQMAFRHYAVWWLSENELMGDQIAMASGQRALAKYEDFIAKHEEERWL